MEDATKVDARGKWMLKSAFGVMDVNLPIRFLTGLLRVRMLLVSVGSNGIPKVTVMHSICLPSVRSAALEDNFP